jgi:hypothetical protein
MNEKTQEQLIEDIKDAERIRNRAIITDLERTIREKNDLITMLYEKQDVKAFNDMNYKERLKMRDKTIKKVINIGFQLVFNLPRKNRKWCNNLRKDLRDIHRQWKWRKKGEHV